MVVPAANIPTTQPPPAAMLLADDAYELLRRLDPARQAGLRVAAVMDEVADLQARLSRATVSMDGASPELVARLEALALALDPTIGAPEELRRAATPAYEALAALLARRGRRVRRLRPTNYARNVFHVLGGTAGMLMVEAVLPPSWLLPVAGAMAAWAWSMEIGRRVWPGVNALLMKVFGPVAHAHEADRVNSATWFSTALVLLALTGSVPAAGVALAVLGWADPAAALVGRRFGRLPLVNGRTVEGTLTFAAVGTVVAFLVLSLFHGELGLWARLAMAGGAAAPAAVAELFARRIDDNLAIPVTAAAGLLCAAAMFG